MNLFGWDTAYAISISNINAALANNNGTIPQQFNYNQSGITMQGSFSPWRIVKGGSGKLLRMEFPVQSGTFSMAGQSAQLDGVVLVAEVNLDLLPAGTSQKNLMFNLKAVAQNGVTGPGLVTPINLLDPNGHLNAAQHGLVYGLFPQYLVDHASQITFVFANVNFVPPATDSWLAPVQCDYAYLEKNDGSSYLGILSVTTNRDISGLDRNIDPAIVSGNNNAGILISKQLFLRNVIFPLLPSIFQHGTTSNNFSLNANGDIVNHGSFPTDSVKKGAITYQPQVDSLLMTCSANYLLTSISGSCDLGLNMSMTFGIVSKNVLNFNPANYQLTFAPDPNPYQTHDSHIPWYDYLFGVIPDIIIAIVVPEIADGIADDLDKYSSSINLAQAPPMNIGWPGMKPITIGSAGLSDNYFMQGNV